MLETSGLRFETFTHKGCKIAAQKKSFFSSANFALLSRILLVSVLLSASVERFFVSRMRDFFLYFPFITVSNSFLKKLENDRKIPFKLVPYLQPGPFNKMVSAGGELVFCPPGWLDSSCQLNIFDSLAGRVLLFCKIVPAGR